jgi:cell division protein FtsW
MTAKAMRKAHRTAQVDYPFIAFVVLLAVFGFLMLSSASSDVGARQFGDSAYFLKRQFMHLALFGIPGFFAGLFMPYQWLKRAAVPVFAFSLLLLMLVFIPSVGVSAKGAARWIDVGGFTFQPGEIMKLSIIIFFSAWLAGNKERVKSFTKGFMPFMFILGVVAILFFLQPSTTLAVIIAAACFIIYFVNGLPWKYFFIMVAAAVLAVSVLVAVSPYRFSRVSAYLTHTVEGGDKDFERGAGFQLKKTLFAMRSGGLYGVGFGNSATKTSIPEVAGDAIFAVVGEEFGFLGATALLAAFSILIWRGFWIAKRVSDDFGKSLVIGFTSIIALQSAVNIGAISGLFPLTGVPLPFISYGGTALAVFLTMGGIIANISRYRR